MSAYDELVERAAQKAICAQMERGPPLWVFLIDHNKTPADLHGPIRAALAEVFRTLEVASPDMVGPHLYGLPLEEQWRWMLRASPLAAPAEKERGI